MPGIAVEIVIDAPSSSVWQYIEDIGSHVDWMHDATAIRFLSDQRAGVGTRFECDTVIGPVRLTDVMEITDWDAPRTIGVQHSGIVGGTGVFRLRPSGSTTVFSWVEELRLPWYLGGPVGVMISRPVLKSVWRRNLVLLKEQVEAQTAQQRRNKAP